MGSSRRRAGCLLARGGTNSDACHPPRRDYFPLWCVTPESIERLDPWFWIKDIAAIHHFGGPKAAVWYSGPACEAALQHLAERRIHALPRLVSVMPYLLGSDVENTAPGVARLYATRGQTTAIPPYAQLNPRVVAG